MNLWLEAKSAYEAYKRPIRSNESLIKNSISATNLAICNESFIKNSRSAINFSICNESLIKNSRCATNLAIWTNKSLSKNFRSATSKIWMKQKMSIKTPKIKHQSSDTVGLQLQNRCWMKSCRQRTNGTLIWWLWYHLTESRNKTERLEDREIEDDGTNWLS